MRPLCASQEKIARHLQVPIQSGSDDVLRAMRRNYRVRHYARAVETLRRRVPDIGLGADVIVGFPGETDEDLLRTVEFIEASPLQSKIREMQSNRARSRKNKSLGPFSLGRS